MNWKKTIPESRTFAWIANGEWTVLPIVAFLASPKASYVTGAVVPADGGRTAI